MRKKPLNFTEYCRENGIYPAILMLLMTKYRQTNEQLGRQRALVPPPCL
jgi:hypothetical protein